MSHAPCYRSGNATQSKELTMITQIKGLHHVTALAANAQKNNDFFTKLLGLRRVKKTVNFDAPAVYHLSYRSEERRLGKRVAESVDLGGRCIKQNTKQT